MYILSLPSCHIVTSTRLRESPASRTLSQIIKKPVPVLLKRATKDHRSIMARRRRLTSVTPPSITRRRRSYQLRVDDVVKVKEEIIKQEVDEGPPLRRSARSRAPPKGGEGDSMSPVTPPSGKHADNFHKVEVSDVVYGIGM